MTQPPERAPAYLLALQDERDAMGRFPRSALPAAVLVVAGAIPILAGLRGVAAGEVTVSLPWILVGGILALPGTLLARHALQWFRRARSIENGIALFEGQSHKPDHGTLRGPFFSFWCPRLLRRVPIQATRPSLHRATSGTRRPQASDR